MEVGQNDLDKDEMEALMTAKPRKITSLRKLRGNETSHNSMDKKECFKNYDDYKQEHGATMQIGVF